MSLQSIIDYVNRYSLMFLAEIFVGITIVFPIVILQMRYSNWKKNRNNKNNNK